MAANEVTRQAIVLVLQHYGDNFRSAASRLGVRYSFVQQRLTTSEKKQTGLHIDDVAVFAEGYGVPISVIVAGTGAVHRYFADLNRSLHSLTLAPGQMELPLLADGPPDLAVAS